MKQARFERRNFRRRPVFLPIAIVNENEKCGGSRVLLGRLQDASVNGVRIVTSKSVDFKPGDRFVLYALCPAGTDQATAIEIRVEVVWHDAGRRTVGMKVLHDNGE